MSSGSGRRGSARSLQFSSSPVRWFRYGQAGSCSASAGRAQCGGARSVRRWSLGSSAAAARSIWVLGGLLVVAALLYAPANPAANQALARSVQKEHRGKAFGLKHAGIPGAVLLAGLAVPGIVTTVGWRWAYVVGAVFALAVSSAVPRGIEAIEPTHLPEAGEYRPKRRLGFLAVGAFFAVYPAMALGGFGVLAAVDAGIDLSVAGLLLSLGSVVSIVVRVSVGVLVDRRSWRGLREMSVLLVAGSLVLLVMANSTGVVYGVAMLAAFGTAWAWPGLMTYAVVRAHPGAPAAASAVVHIGLLAGAGLAPIVIGVVAESIGFGAAWVLVAASGIGSAAMLILVDRAPEWRSDYDTA